MDIFFAQIREDSRVERDIVERKNPEQIAVIGSGGCTAFSILSDSANKVYCVDLNPAQCALTELKKAAINAFDRDSYLAFIGENSSTNRLQQYHILKDDLPQYARNFWDANLTAIETGVNKCGVTEKFYAAISREILQNLYDEHIWKQLFASRSIIEQQEFYWKYFTEEKWTNGMLKLLSKTNHLRYFPAFMFAQAQEDDFGKFFLHQFEIELQNKPVKNNYFLSQFLFGKYLENEQGGMPFYLSEKGYAQTRKNLYKLEIIPSPLDEFLYKQTGINAFFLSNLFDWTNEITRNETCKSILKSAAENATVLYRNMLSEPELPAFFINRFKKDEELSATYHNSERSMLYRKITVGEIA